MHPVPSCLGPNGAGGGRGATWYSEGRVVLLVEVLPSMDARFLFAQPL